MIVQKDGAASFRSRRHVRQLTINLDKYATDRHVKFCCVNSRTVATANKLRAVLSASRSTQARVICQVRLLDYKMLNARNVLVECLTDTSRHPDRCEEHVRAGNLTYEVEK